jgi:hypothetical protein
MHKSATKCNKTLSKWCKNKHRASKIMDTLKMYHSSPIQRWNSKLRALRNHLRGWARHVSGVIKKENQRLSSIIDDLEALAEISPLSLQQIELKNHSSAKIASLLHEEEIKWYQRSKSKFILEGDSNTR